MNCKVHELTSIVRIFIIPALKFWGHIVFIVCLRQPSICSFFSPENVSHPTNRCSTGCPRRRRGQWLQHRGEWWWARPPLNPSRSFFSQTPPFSSRPAPSFFFLVRLLLFSLFIPSFFSEFPPPSFFLLHQPFFRGPRFFSDQPTISWSSYFCHDQPLYSIHGPATALMHRFTLHNRYKPPSPILQARFAILKVDISFA